MAWHRRRPLHLLLQVSTQRRSRLAEQVENGEDQRNLKHNLIPKSRRELKKKIESRESRVKCKKAQITFKTTFYQTLPNSFLLFIFSPLSDHYICTPGNVAFTKLKPFGFCTPLFFGCNRVIPTCMLFSCSVVQFLVILGEL